MNLKNSLMVICVLALFAACATPPPAAPTPPKRYCTDGRELPLWTAKGGLAFPAEAGKIFYGVGMASNISNPGLLREAADNRAINDLGKQFEVYTSSLMEDYMASTSAEGKQAEEQNVEVVKKTVVKQTLNGVTIADRCQESASGMFYSLAQLNMSAFKDAIERKAELGEKMKEFVRSNAERMAEKLSKEEGKR